MKPQLNNLKKGGKMETKSKDFEKLLTIFLYYDNIYLSKLKKMEVANMIKIRIFSDFFERAYIQRDILHLPNDFSIEKLLALLFWNDEKKSPLITLVKNKKEKLWEAMVDKVDLDGINTGPENINDVQAIFLGIDIQDYDKKIKFSRPKGYQEHPLPKYSKIKAMTLMFLTEATKVVEEEFFIET